MVMTLVIMTFMVMTFVIMAFMVMAFMIVAFVVMMVVIVLSMVVPLVIIMAIWLRLSWAHRSGTRQNRRCSIPQAFQLLRDGFVEFSTALMDHGHGMGGDRDIDILDARHPAHHGIDLSGAGAAIHTLNVKAGLGYHYKST